MEALDRLYEEAAALVRAGRYEQAADRYRSVLSRVSDYGALVGLARVMEHLCEPDAASELYRRASAVVPGMARPFSRRVMLEARRLWGPPPDRRVQAPPDRPRLSMTTLGQNGRFGNQVFQYGFLRLYTDLRGLELELPDWPGRDLFGCDEPYPAVALPEADEKTVDLAGTLPPGSAERVAGVDVRGFCQYPTIRLAPWRERWRARLRWAAPVARGLDRWLEPLGFAGRTLVAVHIRRGDFGGERFWRSPTEWYLPWLRAVWPDLRHPLLYVASDDPGVVEDFRAFRPVTAAGAGPLPEALAFLVDFEVLRRAAFLAVSNSSFSVAAAMLNVAGHEFVRPVRARGRLEPFDPWNTAVLL
ncbi:hypothetical protein [Azospirillum halopraeferens]|uniref:hypothetical protein n=1 Tax=Azospirillum halopraeferens TaxID=34010 RepID=UPI000411B813|nr:hypothetical protein [Azospirillum halopraeferens]